jgi:hypothetical protein
MSRTTAIKLEPKSTAVSTGVFKPSLFGCDEDGSVEVTWADGSKETINLKAGCFRDCTGSGIKQVEVKSGKFSFQS